MMYRTPEPPERRSRVLKGMLYSVLGLVVLVLLGATALFLAPPTGLIRDRLVAEVKSRTGRDLSIAGSASLTFFPALGVTLKDVTLSAPPAMPGAPLIVADSLEVQVALLPLVTREVAIDRLVLRRPVIDLRVDAAGRRSWDFAEAETLRQPWPPRYAQAQRDQSQVRDQAGRPIPKELQDFAKNSGARGKKLGALNDLSLADVQIIGGTLRYADVRQAVRQELTAIDARISLKQLAGPLNITGTFVKAGEPVAIEARVQSFKDAFEEQPTKVTLKLGAKPLAASYDGTLAGGLVTVLDGRLDVKSPSLDALARFLGVPLAGLDVLGPLAIDGQLRVNGAAYALSGANLVLGDTAAAGKIDVETSGARPQVKAALRFAALDLNRFNHLEVQLAPAAVAIPAAPPATGSQPATAGRFAPPARSIEDLIEQSGQPNARATTPPAAASPAAAPKATPKGAQVRGFMQRDGWSSEALNLAGLRLVDVDGRFDFGRITWANLKIGQTASTVLLKDGVLNVSLTEVDLYGGKAKGLINLDAREPEMTFGANISGDGVAALALLRDAAGFETLDGRSRLVVAVSARGGSERELIGTLAGRADLHLTNGNVIGWDAGQMLAGLGQGRIPKLDRQPTAKTPFTELSATFQITNGVARTQDVKFESPAVRSTGSGLVNIVDRNIDLTLRPKQAAAAPGGLSFDVPVRIAGPWDKVSVIPELGSALKTPQAQEAVKKLKDGDVDGALKSVLGGGPKADEKIGKAKDMLKQFLKQ